MYYFFLILFFFFFYICAITVGKMTGVKKRKKHISVLFMLAAGLIILAHQVIPHHHQYTLSCSYKQTDNQQLFLFSDANTDFFHCHAFNELYNEKIANFKFIKQIWLSSYDLILTSSKVVIFLPCLKTDLFNYSICKIRSSAIFTSSPLRAPPIVPRSISSY